MAIKGKNKSKSRSGAARRRPTAAPRPAASVNTAKPPWYRTMAGQLTAIVALLAVIGVVIWRVEASNSANATLEKQQGVLTKYTDEVEGYVNAVQPTIREMLGAPFNTANPEGLAALADTAPKWIETLEAQGALIQSVVPPEELVAANVTLQQSFLMYSSSAKLYAMVPGEDAKRKIQDLLDRASEVRQQAGVVLGSALGVLEEARRDAEMSESGIENPGMMTPILPTPSPVEDSDGGSNKGEKKKKNDG